MPLILEVIIDVRANSKYTIGTAQRAFFIACNFCNYYKAPNSVLTDWNKSILTLYKLSLEFIRRNEYIDAHRFALQSLLVICSKNNDYLLRADTKFVLLHIFNSSNSLQIKFFLHEVCKILTNENSPSVESDFNANKENTLSM